MTHTKYPAIKDTYGSFHRSAPVDISDVFVINLQTRNQLLRDDPRSAAILKAFYPGDKLRRWHADSQLHWLIYTPKGQVDIDAYPAVKAYLESFRDQLEKRAGDQKWYELDHVESTGVPDGSAYRLGIGGLQPLPGFVMGEKDAQYGSGSFYINNADYFLFALLNSSALSKLMALLSSQKEDGMYEILHHHLETLPIPDASGEDRAKLGRYGHFIMEAMQDRRDMIRHFLGMTAHNLAPQKPVTDASEKLKNWFLLDFETFRNEIKASFGVDIPAENLQLWDDYFLQEKTNFEKLIMDLEQIEYQTDFVVYELFDLDDDEIAIIASI
jgi:hypothetical protein